MNKLNLVVLIAFGLSLLNSCTKDKNVDDYKQEKLNKYLAQLQSVNGNYTGMLVSNKDGAKLGALKLSLNATTNVSNTTDESGNSAHPVIVANIDFQNDTKISLNAQNTSYDPSSKVFQAEIQIPQSVQGAGSTQSPSNVVISIKAIIDDSGNMNGHIEAVGHTEDGGHFTLARNGESLEQLARQSSYSKDLIFTIKKFSGQTVFSKGIVKPVNLVLLRPKSKSENDFLTLLYPVVSLSAVLNYGSGTSITFSNAVWDRQTKTVNGSVVIGSNPILSISCSLNSYNGFDCDQSTGSSENVAVSHVLPADDNIQDPPDSSADRSSTSVVYSGEAHLESDNSSQELKLTVLYPARSRAQEISELYFPVTEKLMQVSFVLVKSGSGVSFSSAKWDTLNHTLDAAQVTSVNGLAVNLTLACQNFYFTEQKDSFECTYLSSLRNTNVIFRLKSQ